MEDCTQKANIITVHHINGEDEIFENISDLSIDFSDEVRNSSFGDIIVINRENKEIYYFIGKGGHLIENQPDDYTELTVPYEISQYLNDATNKYSEIDYSGIYLNYDDQFLKKNIGDCQSSWNYRYLLLNDFRTLIVNYQDNRKFFRHQFDILKTTSKDIHDFYTYSFYTQFSFLVKYKFEGQDYERFIDKYGNLFKHPEVPLIWKTESHGSGGGSKKHHGIMGYQGPVEFKSEVIEIIKNFYEGFDYEFVWKK